MASPTSQLIDDFQRTISYLRVSLTDQCNLRCVYCTPTPLSKIAQNELLTYEELLRVIGLAVDLGIGKVRLTGGEPLVRKGILYFIDGLSKIDGLHDIRLTTNGIYLEKYGQALWDAGVRKLNISLDSLKADRVREITGADCFAQVWRGINLACDMGFAVKINMVAMRGINDDEVVDFARLVVDKNIQVRYIEFMPIGNSSSWGKEKFISGEEIKARIEAELGELHPLSRHKLDGPARVFTLATAQGRIGFISPLSHKFCDRCNRLRLTSEGHLRSCLLTDEETDLRQALRSGCSDEEIVALIKKTIKNKPEGHAIARQEKKSCHGKMSRIGG